MRPSVVANDSTNESKPSHLQDTHRMGTPAVALSLSGCHRPESSCWWWGEMHLMRGELLVQYSGVLFSAYHRIIACEADRTDILGKPD